MYALLHRVCNINRVINLILQENYLYMSHKVCNTFLSAIEVKINNTSAYTIITINLKNLN